MKGFKGFDKDLKCRDLQYKIGEEISVDGDIKLCRSGLHFCENPHDVFNYYSPGDKHRFAVVEAEDVSDDKNDDDSKRVCKRLTVKAEISVFEICKIAVSTFFENFGFKKKIESANTNNAGYKGAARAGNCGAAIVSNNGRVKGGYGCVLVARNIQYPMDNQRYEVTDWACVIVDDKEIKSDTWYELSNGKLVESKDQSDDTDKETTA